MDIHSVVSVSRRARVSWEFSLGAPQTELRNVSLAASPAALHEFCTQLLNAFLNTSLVQAHLTSLTNTKNHLSVPIFFPPVSPVVEINGLNRRKKY